MTIDKQEITVGKIVEGYVNNDEQGVRGFGGLRPDRVVRFAPRHPLALSELYLTAYLLSRLRLHARSWGIAARRCAPFTAAEPLYRGCAAPCAALLP